MISFDKSLKYEMGYFTNNDSLLDTKTIMSIINSIKDIKLLPNYTSVLTNTGLKKMIELVTENSEWKIIFFPDKISIFKENVPQNEGELGKLDDFVKQAIIILEAITKEYPTNAKRIALIDESFEYIKDDKSIIKYYNKLFNGTDFYQKHTPFEWNWRVVGNEKYIIKGQEEMINCISSMNIGEATILGSEARSIINRIIDINTSHQSTGYRFGLEEVNEFVGKARETYNLMIESIIKVLGDN